MDQREQQYFLQLLTKIKVNLPDYPNRLLKEEIEKVINQLKGL
jgi:hypothetical protein